MNVVAITTAEAIAWPIIGLFYLVALLAFLREVIKGDVSPIRWSAYRIGVFLDRTPKTEAVGGDSAAAEGSTQVLGRRKS